MSLKVDGGRAHFNNNNKIYAGLYIKSCVTGVNLPHWRGDADHPCPCVLPQQSLPNGGAILWCF